MDQSFQVLENHLIFRRTHAEWFDLSDRKIRRMKELFSSGYYYPLMERDAEGRRIMVVNHSRFDTEKFTSEDAFHLYFSVMLLMLHEEETQISGAVTMLCYDNVTIKYVSSFTVTELIQIVKFLQKACPSRVKAIYLVNLPTFAVYFLTAARAAMTKKLNDRLLLVDDMSGMTQFIDKSLLPKELGGGKFTEAEMMENFMRTFDKKLPMLRRTNEFDIDLAKLSNSEEFHESVGSFRRLEID